jgi:hypothetical protein
MPVSKKFAVYELSYSLTACNQLLITVESLWSQVGEQVEVTRSEIGAVRRLVKQLQVLECMQLYAGMYCYGGALHRMSAFHAFCSDEWPYKFVFSVSRYTYIANVIPCCINCTINTSLLSQKTDAISILADNTCLATISINVPSIATEMFFIYYNLIHHMFRLLRPS